MDKTTINLVIKELKNALMDDGVLVNKIVLFGSQASGKNHVDSDLDLIIISDDFLGKDMIERCNMTLSAESRTRKKFIIPMDILTMTSEEYQESHFILLPESRIVA